MQQNPLPKNSRELGDMISAFFRHLRSDSRYRAMQAKIYPHMKKRLQACFIEKGKNVEAKSKRNRAIAEYFRRFPAEAENSENDEPVEQDIPVDTNDEPNPGLICEMGAEFGLDIQPRIRFDFGLALATEAIPEPTTEPPLYHDQQENFAFDESPPPELSLRNFAKKSPEKQRPVKSRLIYQYEYPLEEKNSPTGPACRR